MLSHKIFSQFRYMYIRDCERVEFHIHFLRFLELRALWNHRSQATSVGPFVLHQRIDSKLVMHQFNNRTQIPSMYN